MFGLPARHRERHCRNERRSFGIVLSLQLSAVRFYDSADAVQTKTIMSLSDAAERFPSPILRFRRENRFWFMEREQEPPITDSGPCNQCALAAIVPVLLAASTSHAGGADGACRSRLPPVM